MQREKKLKKFFGDTPDVPINKDFSVIEGRPRVHSSNTKETPMPDDDDDKSEIFARKRRAEKLQGFFGDKVFFLLLLLLLPLFSNSASKPTAARSKSHEGSARARAPK